MEKEQILSTLNEKIGNTNFSEKTLNDYVDAFIPESEENPDFDKHAAFLKSLYGNFSADVARQVNEAKSKLQQPQTKGESDDTHYKTLEEKLDRLLNAHNELKEDFLKKESETRQSQLLSKVKAEMKRNGATDEYVLRQTLRDVKLDVKKSVAELAKELLASYDTEYTECRGRGASPRKGKGEGAGGSKPFEDFFAKKKAREGRQN